MRERAPSLTVREPVTFVQIGAVQPRPGGVVQLEAPGTGADPEVVLVLSCVQHAPEDLLIQPRLATCPHATQQASQGGRAPPPPEDPGGRNAVTNGETTVGGGRGGARVA